MPGPAPWEAWTRPRPSSFSMPLSTPVGNSSTIPTITKTNSRRRRLAMIASGTQESRSLGHCHQIHHGLPQLEDGEGEDGQLLGQSKEEHPDVRPGFTEATDGL